MTAEQRAEKGARVWRHCRWFDPHPPVVKPGSEVDLVPSTGRPGAECATCGEALTAEQTISKRIEAVLREHAYEWVTGRRWRCPCDSLVRTPDQHRAHIAEQIAAVLAPVVAAGKAEAWDEGYAAYAHEASSFDGETYTPIPNPYRPESTGGAA